ncbi:MAG TPA: hypothetical protein VFH03_17540 [Actinoplanes sp.]|nr:hypothetical protein [Actinoplanes sp.]
MVFPVSPPAREVGGPPGHTYGAVLARTGDRTDADVLGPLRQIRFSGWLARPDQGWLTAVATPGGGTVAAGRRGVVGAGEWLAGRLPVPVLAVRVLADRQLALVMWADGAEIGRYVSDPSREPDAGDDVLPGPLGAEHAYAFADACGRPDAGDDLADVLADELDQDSVIESERLARVLRLLGLPTWVVAAATLPRDIPTGPRRRDLIRLGAGVPGALGRLCAGVVHPVRKRRPPPPVVADPPRGSSGVDPWLL